MNELQTKTVELLGDLGEQLLSRNAIVPLRKVANGSKALALKGINRGFDHNRPVDFTGLGFLAGEVSGLIAYDLDDGQTPPTGLNMLSNSLHVGGHVWTEWRGERTRNACPELKGQNQTGSGAVVCFYDQDRPDKKVISTDLADPDLLRDWYLSQTGLTSTDLFDAPSCPSLLSLPSALVVQQTDSYRSMVEGDGLVLPNLKTLQRGWETYLRSAPEHTRNNRLFRTAVEAYRLGGSPKSLARIAVDLGLGRAEVERTLASAQESARDFRWSVIWRAKAWEDTAKVRYPRNRLVQVVVHEAVRQNSMQPSVSQQAWAGKLNLSQQGVSKNLDTLVKAGLLVKIKKGTRPDGKDWPNDYRLSSKPGGGCGGANG